MLGVHLQDISSKSLKFCRSHPWNSSVFCIIMSWAKNFSLTQFQSVIFWWCMFCTAVAAIQRKSSLYDSTAMIGLDKENMLEEIVSNQMMDWQDSALAHQMQRSQVKMQRVQSSKFSVCIVHVPYLGQPFVVSKWHCVSRIVERRQPKPLLFPVCRQRAQRH